MRSNVCLFPLVAGGLTAFVLVALLFVTPDFAAAAEADLTSQSAVQAGCNCPPNDSRPTNPKLADLKAPLDENDQVAALESLQFALTEVGDGSTYVWHRSHGRLSGLVKPTSSFKDAQGQVCRHILIVLNGTEATRKTETVACRLPTGVWQLDG